MTDGFCTTIILVDPEPHVQFLPLHSFVRREGVEELGDSPAPILDNLGIDPLHPRRWGPWTWVELTDVADPEPVLCHHVHGLLEVLLPFIR
eukprot:CAMPEP_0118641202 /NCGR_PEP_ID=MMETSP0785-20121206/5154_1 /TAXON_ID=91992 /ORGANISM="Bolidomonas pacifica, Strain CCMP 1866" /LENGTH=90 /DNA_ID=CAMNT_0006532627 /DNA_START=215 /DNA_END=484 /DNA_ORIENTATION=-